MLFSTTDSCIDSKSLSCEKNLDSCWHLALLGPMAGQLADEILADFEIFIILYRLNYLAWHFVDISTMLLIVLEVHFSLLF